MLITVPDISSTIAGVGNQPGFARPPPANVAAVFSTSNKVPVSRVDSVSMQAMKDVIETSGEKPMMLSALLDSASAGGAGRIVGEVKKINLSQDLTKQNDETRLNRAEERARQAERRAEEAEEAEAKAKRDLAAAANAADRRAAEARRVAEEKAKRDLAAAVNAADRRAAEAKRELAAVSAEAERKAEAARKATEAKAAAQTQPSTLAPTVAPTSPGPNIQSLQVVEALLGRGQRKVIQRILKSKGYYQGRIDAIFGDLTRAAIRAFQRDGGADETGYLTPDQFRQLVASR